MVNDEKKRELKVESCVHAVQYAAQFVPIPGRNLLHSTKAMKPAVLSLVL